MNLSSLIPARSTLAGGLVPVIAWGASMGLEALGITVPSNVLISVITVLVPVVVHIVPDSIQSIARQLNVECKDLAALMPQTYHDDQDFPETQAAVKTPNNLSR